MISVTILITLRPEMADQQSRQLEKLLHTDQCFAHDICVQKQIHMRITAGSKSQDQVLENVRNYCDTFVTAGIAKEYHIAVHE